MNIELIHGDCVQKLKELPDNSVDSIVTDPPYGLSFMGKHWDYDVPSEEVWRECLRVLKPGGHLLSFAGTRTQHRMAVRIEDAGFEIRDMIAWVYGSGFPKSLNIGKAVDKLQGNERELLATETRYNEPSGIVSVGQGERTLIDRKITKGTSEWEGWGTALKPALEPITVARKPLGEKTVAQNVLTHGTGGINIDGCRVPANWKEERPESWFNSGKSKSGEPTYGGNLKTLTETTLGERLNDGGRFPANLIHDGSEEVVGLFPETTSGGGDKTNKDIRGNAAGGLYGTFKPNPNPKQHNIDKGSAARFFKSIPQEEQDEIQEDSTSMEEKLEIIENWVPDCGHGDPGLHTTIAYCARCYTDKKRIFYCAKASKKDRDEGLEGFETKEKPAHMRTANGTGETSMTKGFQATQRKNDHPTVKPTELMRYLCRLVTPPGGTVLDPFMGSGSTGKAAKIEGFNFIGIEREAEYIEIARSRIEQVENRLF